MSRSIAFECFGSRVTLQMSPGMCDEVNEVASKLMEFGRSRDWQRSLALPPETVFGSPSRMIVDYRKFSTSIRSLSSRF